MIQTNGVLILQNVALPEVLIDTYSRIQTVMWAWRIVKSPHTSQLDPANVNRFAMPVIIREGVPAANDNLVMLQS